MLSSGWISIDPFAYTRDGLPYLATHEWLAQIVLSLIYSTFGSTGIILFRSLVACLSVGMLLFLGPRRLFPTIILGVWGVVIAKGSFLERPQLFTFVIFTAFILLAFRYLDAQTFIQRLRICFAFILLELLWVNMHGGAALLGCAIVTFLILQKGVGILSRYDRLQSMRTVLLLLGTLVVMCVAAVSPPNGFGTLEYLWNLLHDQTIFYIAEWQPRDWGLYLNDLWPFWLAALGSLILGRRHFVFNTLLMLMTAYLSRQAFRHEILFIFAALATCCYQLEHSEAAEWIGKRIMKRPISATVITLVTLLFLGRLAAARSFNFELQDHLFGFGQFDLARGAVDFLEREHITGNMFNTYGIGGYLIHRGYPDRKVFIDGRNVDYGMDFMTQTYAAGVNEEQWKKLTDRYGITYALIDYDAIREKDRLPYSWHLDTNPDWPLVYVDDWVAVYLKKTPKNQPIIDRLQFTHLTPTDLQYRRNFAHVPEDAKEALVGELMRVRQGNVEGVKATLALASIALTEKRLEDAKALAAEAARIRPFSPESSAILGAAYVAEQRWEEAADAYHTLLSHAGDNYPDINHAYIADIFRKAQRPWSAWFVAGRVRIPVIVPPQNSGSTLPQSPSELPNPFFDAQKFNDEGILQAEKSALPQAEESFRTAIMLNPSFAEAWNNLCALLVGQQRTEDAIDACKRGVEIAPELADAHFNLALAYYYQGSLQESERAAVEAKKLGRTAESNALLLLLSKKRAQ